MGTRERQHRMVDAPRGAGAPGKPRRPSAGGGGGGAAAAAAAASLHAAATAAAVAAVTAAAARGGASPRAAKRPAPPATPGYRPCIDVTAVVIRAAMGAPPPPTHRASVPAAAPSHRRHCPTNAHVPQFDRLVLAIRHQVPAVPPHAHRRDALDVARKVPHRPLPRPPVPQPHRPIVRARHHHILPPRVEVRHRIDIVCVANARKRGGTTLHVHRHHPARARAGRQGRAAGGGGQ